MQFDNIMPESTAARGATKSDGGSLGSNLERLSIDERRVSQHPTSQPLTSRPKRAAEPPGQVPDGEMRPQRAAPQAPNGNQTRSKMSAGVVANDDYLEPGKMLLQPETRPLTQVQLVNEVKGISAGLVMVEKKCVEIDQKHSKTTNKLSDEESTSVVKAALRRLATKYAMVARMWRHGIHTFLEVLRHRLPDSLDHMLPLVYPAYTMMTVLIESVPSFVETWIECLGDLTRYRMAIEEIDLTLINVWPSPPCRPRYTGG